MIGGGATALVSDPTDEGDSHLLDSGPTDTGWIAHAVPVSQFKPGGTLTFTVTVYCLQAVPQ